MVGESSREAPSKAPFHLWPVGLLLVLWNGWGVAMAIGSQTERVRLMNPADAVYFEAQPLWLALLADSGALAGVAGAVSLLLQSRWAVRFFAAQIAAIGLSNVYEVAIGASLLLHSPDLRAMATVVAILLFAQAIYAYAMARRGVLY